MKKSFNPRGDFIYYACSDNKWSSGALNILGTKIKDSLGHVNHDIPPSIIIIGDRKILLKSLYSTQANDSSHLYKLNTFLSVIDDSKSRQHD